MPKTKSLKPTFVTIALFATSLLLTLTAANAHVSLDGDPVQGGLLFGKAPPGSQVTLDGDDWMVSKDGYFVFGFGRDETAARRLEVALPDGQTWQQTIEPTEREFNIQRIDGLDQDHVTPPPEVLERIREDAAATGRARRLREQRTDWTDGFIWPVEGPITGVYGSQRILNGEPRNPHWGLDIAAPTGTEVKAPASGRVSLAHPDMYFSGGTLFIDHGHGLVSAFLHLSEILVSEGERIEQGEVIARVGATGRATGPHLDWRMNIGSTRVDPELLLGDPPANNP